MRFISELKEKIKDLYKKKLLDKKFYETYLDYLTSTEDISQMKSILIMAVKAQQINFIFNNKNKQVPVYVPPIYIDKNNNLDKAHIFLTEYLKRFKCKSQYASVPQKLLATSCGLAKYGKNNITYIRELGSYYDLMTFYTDILPGQSENSEPFNWQKPETLEKCSTCKACFKSCPTGAISEDRFLLYGEKCITYFNEQKCHLAFPDWIKESWHNCLIGCNICQKVCPENKRITHTSTEGCEFTEEETQMLLENRDIDKLPEETREKVKKYKLKDNYNIYDLIPRNLPVLLNNFS